MAHFPTWLPEITTSDLLAQAEQARVADFAAVLAGIVAQTPAFPTRAPIVHETLMLAELFDFESARADRQRYLGTNALSNYPEVSLAVGD